MRIPGTSTYFNGLFETSSSPRATLSKQKMKNIVMTTYQEYTISHYSLLTTMNKKVECPALRKPTFDWFQAFNWYKNNLGKIHISQGRDWARIPLFHYSLLAKLNARR